MYVCTYVCMYVEILYKSTVLIQDWWNFYKTSPFPFSYPLNTRSVIFDTFYIFDIKD